MHQAVVCIAAIDMIDAALDVIGAATLGIARNACLEVLMHVRMLVPRQGALAMLQSSLCVMKQNKAIPELPCCIAC